jgi:hypothetical protein
MNKIVILSIVALLLLIQSVLSVKQLSVYRSLQYDKVGTELGSRRTLFSAPLSTKIPTTFTTTATKRTTPLSRNVLIIQLESLIDSASNNITNTFESLLLNSPEVVGVIVVLPTSLDLLSSQANAFKQLERVLLSKQIEKPVYFTFDNESVEQILSQVKNVQTEGDFLSSIVGPDRYEVTVTEKEATTVSPIQIVNLSGALTGKKKASAAKSTIAIVANYDTLSSIPELTRGMTSTGSSVIGLLEIARLFKILYSSANTQGNYDLLFALTGGGRLGYEGAKQFVKQLQTNTKNAIQFVLCLENIAGETLNMHISQKTNDEQVVRLYKEFTQTAKNMGIPFQFAQKAASTKESSWEHEVFSRKRLHAATLSSFSKPESQLLRSSALDRSLNQTLLERNIKMIAESLAKFIYESKNKDVEIFSGSLALNDQFIRSLVETFSQYSRSIPFTTSESAIVDALWKTLQQVTSSINEQIFELSPSVGYKFYGNAKATLNFFKVKPFTFDLLLIVPIALYLAALQFGLRKAGK